MLSRLIGTILIGVMIPCAIVAIFFLFFNGYPGITPHQTAQRIIDDPRGTGRTAEFVAEVFGDHLLGPLRDASEDFGKLNSRNAERIAKVLGTNTSTRSTAVLEDLFDRQEPWARIVGALGLVEQGHSNENVFQFLTATLQAWKKSSGPSIAEKLEEDERVQLALLGFGQLGDSKALASISLVLGTRPANYWVHARACQALSEIGDPSAIPVLVHSLEDPTFNALPEAFRALIALGERRAIPLAIARIDPQLKDFNSGFIVKELSIVTGEDFGFDKTTWLKWWESVENVWTIPTPFLSPKLGGESALWLRASTKNWGRHITESEEIMITFGGALLIMLIFHSLRPAYFSTSLLAALTVAIMSQIIAKINSGAGWEAFWMFVWMGTTMFTFLFFPIALLLGIPFWLYRIRRF